MLKLISEREHSALAALKSSEKPQPGMAKKSLAIAKKPKKIPPPHKDEIKVDSIDFPVPVDNDKIYKKYKLSWTYHLKNDPKKKKHKKNVMFGDKRAKEFTETGNPVDAQYVKFIKGYNTPFSPNFWRVNLLAEGPSLKENFVKLADNLHVYSNE